MEIVEGRRGAFDIIVDDEVIFSKHQSYRFPRPAEIIRALRERRGPTP